MGHLRAQVADSLLALSAVVFAFWFSQCSVYSPIPTSGLQLWLKTDAGVTLNGSTVSRWSDQSGNGNDAIQASSVRQPLLVKNALNGHPVMRFDGIDDRLGFTGTTLLSQLSLFIVLKVDSGATGPYPNVPIGFGDTEGDGHIYGFRTNDGYTGYSGDTLWIAVGPNSWICVAASAHSGFGQWKNLSIVTDKTLWNTSIRLNGVIGTVAPLRGVNTILSVPLGNSHGTGVGGIGGTDGFRVDPVDKGRFVAKCDIAEVIVYDIALSDSLRESVERYLGVKYQIPPVAGAAN